MLPVIRKYHVNRANACGDPFALARNLFNELSDVESGLQQRTGSLDVYEDQKNLYVEAELPGFTQDQIDVTLEDGVLSLSAQREAQKKDKETTYYLQERSYGRWSRAIRLPIPVQDEKVSAEFADGVLKVTLEKQEQAKARKIKIG